MALYVRLSTSYYASERFVKLRDCAAEVLWLRALAYSKEHLTDGHIPRECLRVVGFGIRNISARAQRLVEVGLWEVVEDGWRVPPDKWAKYQVTAAEVEQRREYNRVQKAARRAARQAETSARTEDDESADGPTRTRGRVRVRTEPEHRAQSQSTEPEPDTSSPQSELARSADTAQDDDLAARIATTRWEAAAAAGTIRSAASRARWIERTTAELRALTAAELERIAAVELNRRPTPAPFVAQDADHDWDTQLDGVRAARARLNGQADA